MIIDINILLGVPIGLQYEYYQSLGNEKNMFFILIKAHIIYTSEIS